MCLHDAVTTMFHHSGGINQVMCSAFFHCTVHIAYCSSEKNPYFARVLYALICLLVNSDIHPVGSPVCTLTVRLCKLGPFLPPSFPDAQFALRANPRKVHGCAKLLPFQYFGVHHGFENI